MGEYVEFTFDDGQSVLLEVVPSPAGKPGGGPPPLVPVAGTGGRVSRAARGALAGVLRPLVPVLETVRATVNDLEDQPDEVSVDIGVRITDDLRLGIVGIKGEASFVVKATWKLNGPG